MKVVILLPTLPVYRKDFLENLNKRLGNKGIELSIIHASGFFKKSIKSDARPEYKAIPLESAEFKVFKFRIVWWKNILRTLNEIKPDIVIILFSPGNLTFSIVQLYSYLYKISVGIWSSGFTRKEITGFRKKIRAVYLNLFLKRARFHICYGTAYEDFLIKLGIDRSKIFVAQNTINVEPILNLEIAKTRIESENKVDFLFVGALIKEKNLDLAIKALAKLVREGADMSFTIIGQGLIIDDLKLIVSQEKMEDNIFILGPKYNPELSAYFINSDVFLLPGTGGLAINEAMAYGLPVLSTVGDGTVTDLLYDGRNGYYLNDDASIENIYDTCKKVLLKTKPELIEMGKLSRQIIREKATLDNMVTQFENAVDFGSK